MTVIRRFGIGSAAKISGILSAVFGLVAGILVALIGGGFPGFGGLPGWLVSLVGIPILYGLAGVVFGALYAALYNGVAGVVGGLEIELE